MGDARTAAARPLLALDTSTSVGGVAIGDGSVLLAEVTLGRPARHSEALLPAIEYALASAGCRRTDIGGIVVGAGPGSFTGVRIAAATAKALVHAWSVPLHAWSSLAMVAAGCGQRGRRLVPMFDARRGEVYAACYRLATDGLGTLLPPFAAPIEELLERVQPEDALFVGEGAVLHADRIQARGGTVAAGPASLPRPAALLWLAARQPDAGQVARPSVWEPGYVRASGAQRIRGA
jgi:tRNA threonylcarbamoyladenosine biosynthesis protein TsaB